MSSDEERIDREVDRHWIDKGLAKNYVLGIILEVESHHSCDLKGSFVSILNPSRHTQ